MKAKILIAGGGIIGTSIALHAAQKNDPLDGPIVLLERDGLGRGSSGRSGAILRTHYADRVVAAMARDSLRQFSTFESRTGRSIGFRRTGVLILAGPRQPQAIARIEANVEMLSEMGVTTRVVEAAEIRALFPGIYVESGAKGAWEPDSGCVDPQQTMEAFAALARTYGAATRLGVELLDVKVENGRVVGAITSEGEYEAGQVVLAAGAWTARLLAKLGVDVPLRTLRPENHFLAMPHSDVEEDDDDAEANIGFDIEEDPRDEFESSALAPPGMHPVLVDLEHGFYCRCEPGERRTRVGRVEYTHDEVLDDPDDLREEVDEGFRRWARATAVRRLPEYGNRPDVGSLAAWYTLTPDAHPVMGPIDGIQGLFVVTGFSGHGFKLAPAVGEGMAQMLADESVSAFEPELFAAHRFGSDPAWSGQFGL